MRAALLFPVYVLIGWIGKRLYRTLETAFEDVVFNEDEVPEPLRVLPTRWEAEDRILKGRWE